MEVDAGVGFDDEASDHGEDRARVDPMPGARRKFTSMLDASDDDNDEDDNNADDVSLWSDDDPDTNPTPAPLECVPTPRGAVHPRAPSIADAPEYHPTTANAPIAPTPTLLGDVIAVLERNAAALEALEAGYDALLARAEAVVAVLGG